MAAPILFASVMPASAIFPVVTIVTRGPLPAAPRMSAPEPVTVHCAVGVRTPPYSSGNRYCRSAEQKCELVSAAACSA